MSHVHTANPSLITELAAAFFALLSFIARFVAFGAVIVGVGFVAMAGLAVIVPAALIAALLLLAVRALRH